MKKVFYLSLLVMLLSTCKKDTSLPEPENFYYYLTKEQLNKTPYFTNPKFDTLTFISNKSDTLVFAKAGTDTFWNKSCDCPPSGYDKIYHYQQLRNTYTTIKGEGKFEVRHSKRIEDFSLDQVQYYFNNLYFVITDYRIGTNNGIILYDSIEIKNQYYYNLNELYHQRNQSNIGTALVNKNYGLLQVESAPTSTVYVLANK